MTHVPHAGRPYAPSAATCAQTAGQQSVVTSHAASNGTPDRGADTEAVIAAMLALTASRDPRPHLDAWMDVDLSMAQLRVLVVVSHGVQHGSAVVVGDVAERLGVTLSTASHLIERLVRADLLTRQSDPGDRRRTLLQPTSKGHQLLESLRADGVAQMRQWLQHLDADALHALATGMRALQDVARTHNASHGDLATHESASTAVADASMSASDPTTDQHATNATARPATPPSPTAARAASTATTTAPRARAAEGA